MNIFDLDVLKYLTISPYSSQRAIASQCKVALGTVNRSLKKLKETNLIDSENSLTVTGFEFCENQKPQNAIILAAGFGLRTIPINSEIPKGLIVVHGERLIERLIKQLQEVGIKEIIVVVGYLKEQYEYLIDKFNVKLKVNMDYATKGNLFSLYKAVNSISNSYILPCDVWSENNPFSQYEFYSWYLVTEKITEESSVKVSRGRVLLNSSDNGNEMIGISYLGKEDAIVFKQYLNKIIYKKRSENIFWEEALLSTPNLSVVGKVIDSSEIIEINTYEQLRKIDSSSDSLSTEAITTISKVLKIPIEKITNIEIMKKGMTNRSFIFNVDKEHFIMRIPGEGTDELINREEEALVYEKISDKNLSDETLYINPTNGYKISKFIEDVRVCDPLDESDVSLCMRRLKEFHQMRIKVDHYFDLKKHIEFYESLWKGKPSIYGDYKQTKSNIFILLNFISSLPIETTLCHIDSVPDNFLIPKDKNHIRLIDWEYAAMQDPHIDIAMFGIYSLYSKEQIDFLIKAYFEEEVTDIIKLKIYSYVAICGLLWSNWCEYKRNLGVEFGEYSLRQYRYAKDFYRLVSKELNLEEFK